MIKSLLNCLSHVAYVNDNGSIVIESNWKKDFIDAGGNFDRLIACIEDNIFEEGEGIEFIDYEQAVIICPKN